MIFDSRKVKELEGLNYQQRMQAMKLAYDSLPILYKGMLNTIKFLVLAPVFFLIARVQSWSVLPWLLITVILYPLVTKPITLLFVRPQLAEAVRQLRVADQTTKVGD